MERIFVKFKDLRHRNAAADVAIDLIKLAFVDREDLIAIQVIVEREGFWLERGSERVNPPGANVWEFSIRDRYGAQYVEDAVEILEFAVGHDWGEDSLTADCAVWN